MDISHIPPELRERLAFSYTVAEEVFGIAPEKAVPKQQKKIRSWVEKNYFLPNDDAAEYIGKMTPTSDFIGLMKKCHEVTRQKHMDEKVCFEACVKDFSEDVRNAFSAMIDQTVMVMGIETRGREVSIDVDNCESYVRTLTLSEASGAPDGRFDSLSFASLRRDKGGYVLTGEADCYDDDTEVPFTIRFQAASVSVSCYQADCQTFTDSPWRHLVLIADQILSKSHIPGEFLNDREKALLPLLTEISRIPFLYVAEDLQTLDFSNLKGYFSKYGYEELNRHIDRMLSLPDNSRKEKMAVKLIKKLNNCKYEPLWRELRALVQQSQAEYPTKVSAYCDPDQLAQVRNDIQKQMEAHGYAGQYPDFMKSGSIRGVRLAESLYEQYFVGPEKDVRYHVHCTELYIGGQLHVEFLCGTQCLRKNEVPGDIYSCTFRDHGRRLIRTVTYDGDYIDDEGDPVSDDLAQKVQIAVKRAELQKLTKEERKALAGFDVPWGMIFLLIFLVAGGLFSILMTLGMLLISMVVTVIFAGFSMIPEMFIAVPWWELFFLTWILFGGLMGIITVLTARK